jgi:hypothetical protein
VIVKRRVDLQTTVYKTGVQVAILWKYSFMKGGQHYTLQLLETFRRMPTVSEFRGCNLVNLFLQN